MTVRLLLQMHRHCKTAFEIETLNLYIIIRNFLLRSESILNLNKKSKMDCQFVNFFGL